MLLFAAILLCLTSELDIVVVRNDSANQFFPYFPLGTAVVDRTL